MTFETIRGVIVEHRNIVILLAGYLRFATSRKELELEVLKFGGGQNQVWDFSGKPAGEAALNIIFCKIT